MIELSAEEYPGILKERYEIDECEDGNIMLNDIAIKRACLKKGGAADTERAAKLIINVFRSTKIGKITLEKVDE